MTTPNQEHRTRLLALYGRWRTAPPKVKGRRRTVFLNAIKELDDLEVATIIGSRGLAAIRDGDNPTGGGGM